VNETASLEALIAAASARYRVAGRFALHFARNKLRYDPAYRTVLAQVAAREYHAGSSPWPSAWPPPPSLGDYRGLDINPHEIVRARRALGDADENLRFEPGDIRSAEYGQTDAVVMLDVLHYLEPGAQEQVLRRVRAALAHNGLLLLRIGDAAGGIGHHLGRALDQTVALARRGRWIALACRALADWEQLLGRCGFSSRAVPLGTREGFVNVMLQAQAA
jgi:hypothetical protein